MFYFGNLVRLGMIVPDSKAEFAVTGKGQEYIEGYKKVNDFLERMGILP